MQAQLLSSGGVCRTVRRTETGPAQRQQLSHQLSRAHTVVRRRCVGRNAALPLSGRAVWCVTCVWAVGCTLLAADRSMASKPKTPSHKAVVRRLPSKLTAEEFYNVVDALNIRDDVSWSYFVQGDSGEGYSRGDPTTNPEFRYGRAYLNFNTAPGLEYFLANFGGYPFLDSKGKEWPCIVMRAPLLKVPQAGRRRKDTKFMGTIEQDPDYLEFLAELQKEPEPPKTAEQLMAARDAEEAKAKAQAEQDVTPLVAFMRKKRDEKERRQKVRCCLPDRRKSSALYQHRPAHCRDCRSVAEQKRPRGRAEKEGEGEARKGAAAGGAKTRPRPARRDEQHQEKEGTWATPTRGDGRRGGIHHGSQAAVSC